MSKKLLSVILALALVVSCFAVSAFAIGGLGFEEEEEAVNYTQTWNLSDPVANVDGTYSVDVKLQATAAEGYEYLVGTIQFQLVKTISAGTLTLTNVVAGPVVESTWGEQGVDCDVAFSDVSGKVMIIPTPEDDACSGLDLSTEKVVATLTFAASADVAASVRINIEDAKSAANPDGTLFAARMTDGNVVTGTSVVGQTVTPSTTAANFGAVTPPAQAPELVVVDGAVGAIDTSRTMLDEWDIDGDSDMQEIDGYLYGFDPDNNGSLEEIFTVEGDGEMVLTATDAGSEAATGTIVEVVDNDGNVVARYVNIVFGDVNGDGFADVTDASLIEEHDAWMFGDYGRLFSYQELAGDINVDGACDVTDSSLIEEHDAWMLGDLGRIDVAGIIGLLGF